MTRISRKLKKDIISIFGRGTYKGILNDYLFINTYKIGMITKYTGKEFPTGTLYFNGQLVRHKQFSIGKRI